MKRILSVLLCVISLLSLVGFTAQTVYDEGFEAIDYHWVNVLGFEENSIISESYVYVATWGGVRIIKLSEIVGICSDGRPNYMRGMMYYYECES